MELFPIFPVWSVSATNMFKCLPLVSPDGVRTAVSGREQLLQLQVPGECAALSRVCLQPGRFPRDFRRPHRPTGLCFRWNTIHLNIWPALSRVQDGQGPPMRPHTWRRYQSGALAMREGFPNHGLLCRRIFRSHLRSSSTRIQIQIQWPRMDVKRHRMDATMTFGWAYLLLILLPQKNLSLPFITTKMKMKQMASNTISEQPFTVTRLTRASLMIQPPEEAEDFSWSSTNGTQSQ